MMRRIKSWLFDKFLPAWALDTLRRDNERLTKRNIEMKAEIQALNAYINGMQRALHECGRIAKSNGGET